MKNLIVIVASYLIGSFSWAYFLGKKTRGIDIRDYGSGNAGSTNALRVLGKKCGALTLVLDLLKGLITVSLAGKLVGYEASLLAAFFVVMGHNYSIFLNFKGGKGIATSMGVLFALNPGLGLICALVGFLIALTTKYVSLGSVLGAIIAPLVLNVFFRPVDRSLNILVMILSIFALVRHRANIKRLLDGVENKIK